MSLLGSYPNLEATKATKHLSTIKEDKNYKNETIIPDLLQQKLNIITDSTRDLVVKSFH